MKHVEITNYFEQSQGFETLPNAYKEKVINFFLEDRHYMVDVSDVRFFLKSGQHFVSFETFEDLAEYSQNNTVKGIMACKKMNWPSMDSFTKWGGQVSNLVGEGIELVFLAHVFQFETDTSEEWYIISY